jgi:CheY-like chemotaxis protein
MKSRIQIIDDNVALTTLLAKALAKFGYDPVVENNPLLAVNTVRHYMPDLILLDVMMPERDGGRVLADLRSDLSLRYIPVILLTAIAREAQTLAGTGGIQSTVLSKPVQLQELLQTIESHIIAAKSYNQLQETSPLDPRLTSSMEELPDFGAEGAWGAVLPAGGLLANPSVSFSGQFPSRENPEQEETNGSAFAFPSRSDQEKPGGPIW